MKRLKNLKRKVRSSFYPLNYFVMCETNSEETTTPEVETPVTPEEPTTGE
jgi:hypothetical protein